MSAENAAKDADTPPPSSSPPCANPRHHDVSNTMLYCKSWRPVPNTIYFSNLPLILSGTESYYSTHCIPGYPPRSDSHSMED